MATTYTPKNKKVSTFAANNSRVDDFLNNASDKTDGFEWIGAEHATPALGAGGVAPVLTRNAEADYSRNRTGAGAETYYFPLRFFIPAARLGTSKGFKITDIVVSYSLGVADATTVSLTLDRIVHADGAANVVAAFGGALSFDANHNTNAKRILHQANPHLMKVTLGTPAWQNLDLSSVVGEMTFVLANTGTLAFYGWGFHYTFNQL